MAEPAPPVTKIDIKLSSCFQRLAFANICFTTIHC